MNEMANRIKEIRNNLGMTQEELADKVGLQKSAIAKYENGRVENIKRTMISKLSVALECSPSYLMGFDEEAEFKGHIIQKLSLDDSEQYARLLEYYSKLSDKSKEDILVMMKALAEKTDD